MLEQHTQNIVYKKIIYDSCTSYPDSVDSWAPTRAESGMMQASTSVQTAARRHMMSSISSFARLTRLQ